MLNRKKFFFTFSHKRDAVPPVNFSNFVGGPMVLEGIYDLYEAKVLYDVGFSLYVFPPPENRYFPPFSRISLGSLKVSSRFGE